MRPINNSQTPSYQKSVTARADTETSEFAPAPESNKRISGWVLLPLRLFLGITFVYAGIQKLTDPQFFHKATPNYIGNQIIAFAHGSPLHDLLLHLVLPHAVIFGWLIALGEFAIGIGALFGILLRPAAFFGLLLSFMFFLTASFHVYPYFYGADIVFVFCWLTLLLNGPQHTGLPTVDTWLANYFATLDMFGQRTLFAPLLYLLLGGPEQVQPPPITSFDKVSRPISTVNSGGQRRVSATRRKKETRRSFVVGVLTGGIGVFALATIGYILRSIVHSTDDNQATNVQVSAATAPETGTTQAGGTQASTTIAQVSAVPKNSSSDFNIPATGDPGILVHLSNDQFVAYDATCTHAGCQVGYDPTSQHLICPCHGAEFDPAQGATVLQGPAPTPLTSVAISIDSTTGAIMLR